MLDMEKAWRLLMAEEDEALSRHLALATNAELKSLWSFGGGMQRWAKGFLKERGDAPPIRVEFSAGETERFDDETLMKVRSGLSKILGTFDSQRITDCITEMQNEGILFRERA